MSDEEPADLHSYVQVQRMLWLRAYARMRRWEEELAIVPVEMDSAMWFFNHQAAKWRDWGGGDISVGHRCYAARQEVMWKSL